MKSALCSRSVRLVVLTLFLTVVLAAAPAGAVTEIPGFGPGGLIVASHPDGGWLVVSSDAETGMAIRAVRVLPDGSVGDGAVTEGVEQIETSVRAVAVAPSGRFLVIWTGEESDFAFDRFQAAVFEPDGTEVRRLDLTIPGEAFPSERRSAVAAAAPDGDFLIAWSAHIYEMEPANGSGPVADLFLARFSGDGERLAGPVLVNGERVGLQQPTGLLADPSSIVVSWTSSCCDVGPDPFDVDLAARAFSPDLTPETGAIEIGGAEHPDLVQVGSVLALRPGGRFTVGWFDQRDRPGASEPEAVRLHRTYRRDGAPDGPAVEVGAGWADRRTFGSATTPAGIVHYFWIDDLVEGAILQRPFTLDGIPLGPARDTGFDWDRQSWAFDAESDPAGRILIAVIPGFLEPIEVATVAGETPPTGHVLTSPELPGYRVWVLIGASSPAPRWGTEEPLCLAETLCASGSVPGRTEVLVRVVGPKPNGFLWPTLVKLTTSDVDVWIEQTSTGEVRHYFLPGASPGIDTLDGLFDRFGFSPN